LTADNSLDGVECTAYHPGSGGMAGIMSVIMSLLSIKDLIVAIFHQSGGLRRTIDPPLYKYGSKLVQGVCRDRVKLLIEHSES